MAKDDCNLRIHALPARDGLQILNWTQKRADTHMNASTLEFRQDENKWKMRIASNFFSQCFPPIYVGRLKNIEKDGTNALISGSTSLTVMNMCGPLRLESINNIYRNPRIRSMVVKC